MEFVKVSKNPKDYGVIKRLYKHSFPRNERAPFRLLKKKAESDNVDFLSLYDNGRFIGMAYIIRHKDMAYVFYLAILPDERGKGYGTKMIGELKKRYADHRLFLALEMLDPHARNYEQRLKRHDFYKKCGLKDMPYKIKEASVIYSVMGTGDTVSPEEYREMMTEYLGKFLSRIVDTRIV